MADETQIERAMRLDRGLHRDVARVEVETFERRHANERQALRERQDIEREDRDLRQQEDYEAKEDRDSESDAKVRSLETTRDKYEAMWAKQPASLALGEEVRQFHAAHNAEVDKIADERAVDDRLFLDARAADNKRFDDKQADDRKRLDERQTDERRALVRERFDKQFADREKDVAPKQGGVEKAPEVQAKRPEPAQQLPGIGPERSEQARVRQDSLAPSLGTYSRGSIMGAESRNHGFEVSQQELKNQKCEAEQRNDWGAAKIYDLQHQQNAAAFNRDVMGDVAAKQYCCHGDNADYREYIKESRESGVRADQLALEISQERDRQARGIIPQPLDQLQGRQASVKQAPVADREAPQAKQTPPRVQAGAQQEQPKQTVSKEQRRPQQVQGEVPQVSKPRQATPFSFKATADRAAERTSEQSATLAQGIGQRKPEQAQVERPLSDQAAVAFAKLTFPADEPHQNSGTERAASGQSSQQTSPSQQASKPRQTTPFSFQATAARSAENTAEQAVSQVHGAGQRRPPQVQGAVQIQMQQGTKPRQATPFSFQATAARAAEKASEQAAVQAQANGQRKPAQAQAQSM